MCLWGHAHGVPCRDAGEDRRSLAGLRDDKHLAARRVPALFDAHETEPATVPTHRLDIESAAIIMNGKLDVVAETDQGHLEVAPAAMHHRVSQRFLCDPEQAQHDIGMNTLEIAGGLEGDRNLVSCLAFEAMGFDGRAEPDQL